jgi:hypothetical protein
MLVAGLVAMLSAAAPAAAAVTKPTAKTGGAARVTQTSATLTGSVNPNGAQTTYWFQYGTTTRYGATTGPTSAGNGTHAKAAAADLSGLPPFTRYHFRLVAQNAKGKSFGADRAFTTRKQPLGITLAANPNPATWHTGTSLAGQVTGTGNANQTVKLQQRAFPYTAAFTDVGSPSVTDGNGNFVFVVPLLIVNTQFRVLTTGSKKATSSIVIVGCAVRVGFRTSHTHVRKGQRVRFSGNVWPANDGALYAIQRRRNGVWTNVAGGSLRHLSAARSHYRKTIRVRHAGLYRVFVGVNNQNTSGVSREVRLRLRG